jgi:hypothetical protein
MDIMKRTIEEIYEKEILGEKKELLEKFDDCYSELTDINEREIFVYAFRLGARIAIEVLLPKRDRGAS